MTRIRVAFCGDKKNAQRRRCILVAARRPTCDHTRHPFAVHTSNRCGGKHEFTPKSDARGQNAAATFAVHTDHRSSPDLRSALRSYMQTGAARYMNLPRSRMHAIHPRCICMQHWSRSENRFANAASQHHDASD